MKSGRKGHGENVRGGKYRWTRHAVIIRVTFRRWIRMDNSDRVITCPDTKSMSKKDWQEWKRDRKRDSGGLVGSRRMQGKQENGAAIYYSDTRARCFYDPPYFLP